MSYLAPVETIGGNGGHPFSFTGEANGATLKKLWVWVGSWQVKALKVCLTDGQVKEFGQPAGPVSEFELEDGERIKSLSLWDNGKANRLGALRIRTTRSREFFPKMTDYGLKTERPVDIAPGICLGVSGRSGCDIDSLAFKFLCGIVKTELTDVHYPTLLQVIPQVATEQIIKIPLISHCCSSQAYGAEFCATVTESSSWTVANNMEDAFSFQVKAEIPKVVEVLSGFSFTKSKLSCSGLDNTREEKFFFPIEVPDGKTVEMSVSVGRVTVELPYTGTVKILCCNGKTLKFNTGGIYKGVSFTNLQAAVTEK